MYIRTSNKLLKERSWADVWAERRLEIPSEIVDDIDEPIVKALTIAKFKISQKVIRNNRYGTVYEIIAITGNGYYKIRKLTTITNARRLKYYPTSEIYDAKEKELKTLPKKH